MMTGLARLILFFLVVAVLGMINLIALIVAGIVAVIWGIGALACLLCAGPAVRNYRKGSHRDYRRSRNGVVHRV